MTLAQLRHLVSVGETGSFSRSARLLHLTQPALSRSIRALEDELGEPLFDRVGRHNELTPFGREVLERAKQIVHESEDLRASGRRQREGQSGTVRVGMGSGPGVMLMAPLLRHMATRHPSMRIEVARGRSESLLTALRERRLDALVVDARSVPPAPDLRLEKPIEMRAAFMVRPGHPLLRRRRALIFQDVRAYPLACTPLSDEVARMLVQQYGRDALPAHSVTLCCDDIAGLVEAARDTDAVVLAIRAAGPGLVELNLSPPLLATARFALVTLADRSEAPGLGIVRGVVDQLLHD